MNTLALLVAMLAPAIFVAGALAQTQVPPPAGRSSPPRGTTTPAPGEKTRSRVESRVSTPSRTAIRLSDGTKLVTPPDPCSGPARVLTGLTVKDRGPATR